MAGWMRNMSGYRLPILKRDLWINFNNVSFYKKRSCFTSLHWCHTQPLKQTIWTINQCGIFFSNQTIHYQKSASDKFVDTKKQVWCKQSLICQSSVEAIGMAVWAMKLKTLKNTVCQQKINPFEGKKKKSTVIIKVHPWMWTQPTPPSLAFPPLPSPCWSPQVEPMGEKPQRQTEEPLLYGANCCPKDLQRNSLKIQWQYFHEKIS